MSGEKQDEIRARNVPLDSRAGATRFDRLFVAAVPLKPPENGEFWAFHLVNDSTEAIESARLLEVGYEWGDYGSATAPGLRFGALAPGASLDIWRDDDDAAELRMWLKLVVRGSSGERMIMVEFPRLYRAPLQLIPIIGKAGVIGAES